VSVQKINALLEASYGPGASSLGAVDVALFLPCASNKLRPTDANRDTSESRKWTGIHRVKCAIRQSGATARKRRLTLLFLATNQEVAGSSPAGRAN
jgi:hypothetical protein